MRNAVKRGLAVAAMAATLLFGAVGCTSAVDKDEVAATVTSALQEQGVQVENLTCPEDLEAEVGKTTRCEFTTGGQPVDAVVSVTAVDGTTARYDVRTEPRPVARALLGEKVAQFLLEQADIAVDTSTCGADLQPQVGSSVNCEVTAGAESALFAVTVTSVDGGLINFSIEQV